MAEKANLLIDGAWVQASDGATFPTLNPATQEVLADVPAATAADVDRAMDAAHAAFDLWRKTDPAERGRLLWKVASLVRERADAIARAESLDQGKTLREAKGDVVFAAMTLEYYAGLADKVEGETIPVPGPRVNYTLREPLGVTVHVVPWNFPFQLAVRGIAPALAAGNAVVAKPASYTPLSLLEFGKACVDAGLPKGVVNVLTGGGRVVGDRLVRHARTASVTLTGSCETGTDVLTAAAKNITPVTLELGGKCPNIVFQDADLDKAAKGAWYGAFLNAGQMCWAGSRLLVHDSVHDEVVQRLAKMAEGWKLGPGDAKDTRMGPLVAPERVKAVMGYVEAGKAEGAKLLFGGATPTDAALAKGNYVQPTAFTGVARDMRIAREEIFGPVVSVMRFSTEEEAVAIANDTDFGLYAGVWTKDLARANRVVSGIQAGSVAVNEYPVTFPQSPFAGWKRSGIGSEQGQNAMEFYARRKNVIVNFG